MFDGRYTSIVTYTFLTDFNHLDSDGKIVYDDENGITYHRIVRPHVESWTYNKHYSSLKFLAETTPKEEIKKIEKAIHHLYSFCASDDDLF
jgi:hypothetical protein